MKKLGLPVTDEMQPFEAFTLKEFVDQSLNVGDKHMWYTFGDLMRNVSE